MHFLRIIICLLLAICSTPVYSLQAQPSAPAVLQIYRDHIKPSKMAEYSRIEGEAAETCAKASTWPYLAIQSMTGPQEVWFLSGFDSYTAMEQSAAPFARNAALNAELSRLQDAKANLVDGPRAVFAQLRDDLSSNSGLIPAGTRFFTVTMVTIHPGHEHEYEEIHRALRFSRQRAGVQDNRIVYQIVSGMPRNIYLIFSAHHSLQNAGVALNPAVDDYSTDVDDSTRSRLDESVRQSVETSETWLFSVSPAMSNPAGEWIADDPEFWRSSPPLQRQVTPKKPVENTPH